MGGGVFFGVVVGGGVVGGWVVGGLVVLVWVCLVLLGWVFGGVGGLGLVVWWFGWSATGLRPLG